eukprot:3491452-Rhodomonas_salina.1
MLKDDTVLVRHVLTWAYNTASATSATNSSLSSRSAITSRKRLKGPFLSLAFSVIVVACSRFQSLQEASVQPRKMLIPDNDTDTDSAQPCKGARAVLGEAQTPVE